MEMYDSVTATVLSTSTSSSLQSCWIVYTNNQGTERLVVTRRNNGPIDSNLQCGTAAAAASSGKINVTSAGNFSSSHNSSSATATAVGVTSGESVSSKTVTRTSATTTAEADLDYKSLNSILDDNLRPLKPIPGNPRSEHIHDEHKQLVQEYWEIQTQIVTNQAHRDALQMNMPAEELRLKKEYLKKLEEKEALLKFKANLQKQLDERKRLASIQQQQQQQSLQTHPAPAASHQPQIQQNQHQQSAPPPSLPAGQQSAGQQALQRQDSTTESGWVLITSDEPNNNSS